MPPSPNAATCMCICELVSPMAAYAAFPLAIIQQLGLEQNCIQTYILKRVHSQYAQPMTASVHLSQVACEMCMYFRLFLYARASVLQANSTGRHPGVHD